MNDQIRIIWRPQPGPQTLLLQCPYDQIFFGGARGGGKTSGVLGHWVQHAQRWGRFARGILFRKTYDELEEVKEQAAELFPRLGAKYHEGKRTWTFPNGAKLRFRFFESDKDASKYQGHAYTWMCWEEITNWSSHAGIDKVSATLRSARGVKCQWLATGNPGGVGHNWVKARFISPAKPLHAHKDPLTGELRIFIPSKLSDNRILMHNDPKYAERLKGAGPAWLVKAWLGGIWDIVAGGMFDDVWSGPIHVLQPFKLPPTWPVKRSFDWGSSHPFSLGWWAESNGETLKDGRRFYPGTMIRIAEWYGSTGQPNEGLKMIDTDIAREALEKEASLKKEFGIEEIEDGPADPSIFAVSNGVCIGTGLSDAGLGFVAASGGPGSRKSGWQLIRRMMKASTKYPMEESGLFVFDTCRDFIRTVPVLPRDLKKIDDVDTTSEDHVGDETRYALSDKVSKLSSEKLVGI